MQMLIKKISINRRYANRINKINKANNQPHARLEPHAVGRRLV